MLRCGCPTARDERNRPSAAPHDRGQRELVDAAPRVSPMRTPVSAFFPRRRSTTRKCQGRVASQATRLTSAGLGVWA